MKRNLFVVALLFFSFAVAALFFGGAAVGAGDDAGERLLIEPLAANDLIRIEFPPVILIGDKSLEVRVQPDGKISLLSLGLIKVAGLTELEAAVRISDECEKQKLMDRASVSVRRVTAAKDLEVPPEKLRASDFVNFRIWVLGDDSAFRGTVGVVVGKEGTVRFPGLTISDLRGLTLVEAEKVVQDAIKVALKDDPAYGDAVTNSSWPDVSALWVGQQK